MDNNMVLVLVPITINIRIQVVRVDMAVVIIRVDTAVVIIKDMVAVVIIKEVMVVVTFGMLVINKMLTYSLFFSLLSLL
jgi:hypothetical protein